MGVFECDCFDWCAFLENFYGWVSVGPLVQSTFMCGCAFSEDIYESM